MTTIYYTVNDGPEKSYTANPNDLRRIKYEMNNSVGYPADPGIDVLAFVCYLFGEYPENVYHAFDGLIDWDAMFEDDPMDWFNNVVAPALPEECGSVFITDIAMDIDESRKAKPRKPMNEAKRQCRDPMRKVRALREEEEEESEDSKVEFTEDELKVIGGRIFVESEWAKEGVYDASTVEKFNSIMEKLDAAGIQYK